MLAIEDDTREIVAQLAYTPHSINVNGNVMKGNRASAIIIKEHFRAQTGFLKMQQMIGSMYMMAEEVFVKQGVDLIFMVPYPRWARIIKAMPVIQSASFPLWSCPLPLQLADQLPEGYSVELIEAGDGRINELWQQASVSYPCMVTRDSRMLAWKIGQDAYQLRGVCYRGALVGFFAFIKKRKDYQWLIADMLTADVHGALEATLLAATLVIEELNFLLPSDERTAYRKIAVLSTPSMEPVLKKLGFLGDNYNFLLFVHPLDKALGQEVAPEQWYVSSND